MHCWTLRRRAQRHIHPQSDGLIERFNRTLLGMLSMMVKEDEQGWDLLPTLLLATVNTPVVLVVTHASLRTYYSLFQVQMRIHLIMLRY